MLATPMNYITESEVGK